MVALEIALNDGTQINTDVESFDPKLYEEKLNSIEVTMVAVGDIVVNKNMVKYIKPVLNES